MAVIAARILLGLKSYLSPSMRQVATDSFGAFASGASFRIPLGSLGALAPIITDISPSRIFYSKQVRYLFIQFYSFFFFIFVVLTARFNFIDSFSKYFQIPLQLHSIAMFLADLLNIQYCEFNDVGCEILSYMV